jgi:hypothetical protein
VLLLARPLCGPLAFGAIKAAPIVRFVVRVDHARPGRPSDEFRVPEPLKAAGGFAGNRSDLLLSQGRWHAAPAAGRGGRPSAGWPRGLRREGTRTISSETRLRPPRIGALKIASRVSAKVS